MENPESAAASPVGAWNTRDLATVVIAVLGVWVIVQGLFAMFDLVRRYGFWIDGTEWASIGGYAGLGFALVLGASRLARLAFREPTAAAAPNDVVPLVAAGLAVLGAATVLASLDAIVRVTLPFVEYGQVEPIPIQRVVADAGSGLVGILLFAKAGVIARQWGRWTARG